MEIKRLEPNKSKSLPLLLGFCLPSILIVIAFLFQIENNGFVIGDRFFGSLGEGITNPLTIGFFSIMTDVGSKWGIGSCFIVSILVAWVKYKDYIGMVVLTIAVIGGDFLNKWFKELVGRERPAIDPEIYAEGFSFPSGHAMVGLAFFGFLTYYVMSKITSPKGRLTIGIILSLNIFLIGISRVFLHAHYLSDVIGGFLLGGLLLVLCIYLYEKGNSLLKNR